MSRNLIIAILVGVAVIGGGVALYATQSDNDNNLANTDNSEQADQQESGTATFSPENTLESDFEATIATESDTTTFEATIEYDADSKAWRYVAKNSDQDMELIVSTDAYYSKVEDKWIKLPSSGESGTGFDREAYELTDEELAEFQSRSSYKGEVSCPAGTCDLWEVENYEGNNKLSFYVDKETNTINQLVTVTASGTSTITYTYKDVTIEIPTDAQEVPSLTAP